MDNRREQIIDIVKREFIGPDPVNKPGLIQENGEEILTSDPPRIRYSAGILFPQHVEMDKVTEEYEPEIIEVEDETDSGVEGDVAKNNNDYKQVAEELMNLSNAYQQSAMSMTVAVKDNDQITVAVSAGTYRAEKELIEGTPIEKVRYLRSQLHWENDEKPLVLPKQKEIIAPLVVKNGDKETALRFHANYRYRKGDCTIYTFTLENSTVNEGKSIHDEECFFQVEFRLRSELGFNALPENEKLNLNDEDFLSNQMLYRNVHSYAVGHGCAAEWKTDGDTVTEISTAIFPVYEMKPIVPNSFDGISLEMYKMSDRGTKEEILKELKLLCSRYEEWIRRLSERASEIPDRGTATRHIKNCEDCLERMKDGVSLLETDERVLQAFQLMNRAMLLQQLHYNIPLQTWTVTKENNLLLNHTVEKLPDIDDPETWGAARGRFGKWRPFQLAFVLINLKSMYNRNCDERSIVDLIWFPTGGGKTEAYLGLSAYTIFIRRIMNCDNAGTTILMRYTLRLLTSQQYERAASMICACEIMRNENEELLGKERISVGLWVGGDTSPNTMKDAITGYNKYYNGDTYKVNPFIILKCPWCGAQMGVVSKGQTPGYKKIKRKSKTILMMKCSNTEQNCPFTEEDYHLPLYIVDEDIYEKCPTLLLGTVDKFAMLPYRPEAQTIFGIHNGARITAPDLIIQDELHLISGPLGSMVGHYETMIHELCSYNSDEGIIQPKIIASTATISRAAEQCHALYGCGTDHVRQFPPSGLEAGDSFFAVENKAAAGRKYVGIAAPAASSIATTMIRLYASLLYAGKAIEVEKESMRDPYWTNVGYFNSIRELGQTETWIHADIDEYLHVIYLRRYEDKEEGYKNNRRYIVSDRELTSRISSDRIPAVLQEMSIRYPSEEEHKKPVDICLATNMISVGVDLPRLGLMTVAGQPKTTSEYIQATSRVGRSSDAPGLIFTVYNPGKPRDRSHYEHFVSYHSRVYCNVEPTSVTPFSGPLRDRALHALLIGLYRLEGDKQLNSDPPKYPDQKTIDNLKETIANRVSSIDKDELNATLYHLDSILDQWKNWEPEKYQDFNKGSIMPLMFPAGTKRNSAWLGRGFETPTSMRNVDAECEARLIDKYYSEDE